MEFLNYEPRHVGDDHVEIGITVSGEDVAQLIYAGYKTLAEKSGMDTSGTADELYARLLDDPQRSAEDLAAITKGYVLSCCVPYAIDRLDEETITEPMFYCEEEPQAGVDFDAKIIARIKPQLALTSYEPVTVELPEAQFGEADVDERLQEFAVQHATYVDSARTDPIQLDDFAHVDLQISTDGKVIPQLTGAHNLFQCSYKNMPEEFIDQMLGMRPGDTREFDFTGPRENALTPDETANYHARVTLTTLVDRVLPDITDAWFKENYPMYGSLREFKDKMLEKLRGEAAAKREQMKGVAVDQAIAERLDGPIPDEIYEYIMDAMTSNFMDNLKKMGLTKEEYFEKVDTDEREYTTHMMLEARRGLRQSLALDALFRGRGMELTDEDIHDYLGTIAPGKEERLLEEMKENGRYYVVTEGARRHKAHKWLLDTATFDIVGV